MNDKEFFAELARLLNGEVGMDHGVDVELGAGYTVTVTPWSDDDQPEKWIVSTYYENDPVPEFCVASDIPGTSRDLEKIVAFASIHMDRLVMSKIKEAKNNS